MANVSFYLFIKLSAEFKGLSRPVHLTSLWGKLSKNAIKNRISEHHVNMTCVES